MRSSFSVLVGLVVALAAGLTARSLWADPADDQYAVAAGLYAREDWKSAAEEFKAFLDEYPNDSRHATAVFFFAETSLQLKAYQQAGVHFRRYLETSPQGKHARPALFRAGEVAYLASESCDVSGEVFSVAGGSVSRMFVGLAPGWFKHPEKEGALTPEDVEANLDQIRSEDGYMSGITNQEEIQKIAQLLLS